MPPLNRYTLVDRRGPAPPPVPQGGADRREAIAWMTAGVSLAMAGCGKPRETITPAASAAAAPGSVGAVEHYATSLPLGGYGRGFLVTSRDGRPTKVEGDPRHPFSLGATDVFAEAEVLSLYDPARMTGAVGPDGASGWQAFEAAMAPVLDGLQRTGGAGFTLVTPRVTSPTELRLIHAVQAAYPKAAWRRFEAIDDDNARAGARLAFGRELDVRLDLAPLGALVCLGADPLGPGPAALANARAFAGARDPAKGEAMLRLYAAEPGWSLTGMNADHRLAATPGAVREIAIGLARSLGAPIRPTVLTPEAAGFVAAAAADLKARRGGVLAGRSQPPEVHALAHWINATLHAFVQAIPPVDPHPEPHAASRRALFDDLRRGDVHTLLMLGGDPAADLGAPAGALLRRPPLRIAATVHPNATAALGAWRLALAHPLESWSDLRAVDGSASLVQPLIDPLHDGRTAAEILQFLLRGPRASARDLVRATWSKADADAQEDAARFTAALDAGVIEPAPPPQSAPSAHLPEALSATPADTGLILALAPDPTLYDGRYAENAWLQECPKPLTHETWGASLHLAPADARRLGVKTGDHLAIAGLEQPAPVRIVAGHAEGVITGFLGGGRRHGGPIGTGVGVDLCPLRAGSADGWTIPLGPVAKASGPRPPPAVSQTARLEGEAESLSPIVAAASLRALAPIDRTPERPPSLYPPTPPHAPSWAMVIDASACIGCNSCVVACQSENNVPVVGPDEVARGRDMHWLRIDGYDLGGEAQPRFAFQPVPCMQCEHAPCEPVCPVEASVHDHEGLNDQVYNRCIGTRFCEANCPYKVRRFNFHGYAHEQAYANLGEESFAAQKNPEVTVRARGVMEKCTYCVQRISEARRTAEKENRPIREGEVVTACQSACPTQAIRFGDLSDPHAAVNALRKEARHYALLAELGTRPRTTYLAKVRNPSPALEPRG